MNWQAYLGNLHRKPTTQAVMLRDFFKSADNNAGQEANLLWNHSSPRVPPKPISDLKTSVMGMPA